MMLLAMRVLVLGPIAVVLGLAGCGRSGELKPIQKQEAGDWEVSVLSATGDLKAGKGTFTLEFRKLADRQLTDPGNVRAGIAMPMGGMAPMIGSASVDPSGTPGRFRVTYDVSMAGTWNMSVTFGKDEETRFGLSFR